MFGVLRTRGNRRKSRCNYCCAKASSDYRKTEAGKRTTRKANLRFLFGMSLEDYDALVESQNGLCAVCGTDQPGTKSGVWPIDHSHDTNEVRGLLCLKCNTLLGMSGDSIEVLAAAIEYLRSRQ